MLSGRAMSGARKQSQQPASPANSVGTAVRARAADDSCGTKTERRQRGDREKGDTRRKLQQRAKAAGGCLREEEVLQPEAGQGEDSRRPECAEGKTTAAGQ
jgi:hypothetical protein